MNEKNHTQDTVFLVHLQCKDLSHFSILNRVPKAIGQIFLHG